jgi:hypothetical protein
VIDMLPPPIGFITLYEAVDAVGRVLFGASWQYAIPLHHEADNDCDPHERVITMIAEGCEAGAIEAGYRRSWDCGVDALDRNVWHMPHWRNYFATGTIDLIDLPLVDQKGRPDPDGGTVPRCTREIFLRKDSLGEFIKALAPPVVPPSPSDPARRGGRPPAYPWDKIQRRVHQLMGHHGEFSVDDPKWNAQARLEEILNEEFGVAISTLREPERLPKFLADWRKAKVGN